MSLQGSKIRNQPKLGPSNLLEVPKTRSVSIAASSAQNDSGVFEFSFRDDRYMPFEGAGAISQWRLQLPKTFRPFDYNTINDVILSIGYTAESDAAFGEAVEQETSAAEGALVQVLQTTPLERVFSLRQEFSSAFHMLLAAPLDTSVQLAFDERHLPIFLQGKAVRIDGAALIVQPAPGASAGGLTIAVNGREQSGFAPDPRFGNLPAVDLGTALARGIVGEQNLAVVSSGDLGPDSSTQETPALSAEKLDDILIHLAYRLD